MGANHLPLQSIQDDYRVKVKFAIADPHDLQQYRGEAYTEYMGFFQDPANFPSKWLVGEGGNVNAGEAGTRASWRLSGPTGDVLAVEHETGLELLGALAAVVGLFQFGLDLWDRWQIRRKQAPPSPYGEPSANAFVVECRSTNPTGVITQWKVTVPQAQVKHELIASLLDDPRCHG